MYKKNGTLIYGFGINNSKQSCFIDGKLRDSYKKWYQMIRRCYDEKSKERNPTYKGCRVCEEWKYYESFKGWYEANRVEGYDLDKDLLSKGEKVYSPDTCCFLPKEVNAFLTNIKHTKRGKILPAGITLHKRDNIYYSRIGDDGHTKILGYFEKLEDALKVYREARSERAKVLAERYKDRLDPRAYNALMNYKEV